MSVFRSIVFSAAIAGLTVGAVITVAQLFATVPLIQQSELYERKAEAAPDSAKLNSINAAHDHAAREQVAHQHETEWEPNDGLERNLFTAAANILTAIGFGLLLTGIFA